MLFSAHDGAPPIDFWNLKHTTECVQVCERTCTYRCVCAVQVCVYSLLSHPLLQFLFGHGGLRLASDQVATVTMLHVHPETQTHLSVGVLTSTRCVFLKGQFTPTQVYISSPVVMFIHLDSFGVSVTARDININIVIIHVLWFSLLKKKSKQRPS